MGDTTAQVERRKPKKPKQPFPHAPTNNNNKQLFIHYDKQTKE